MGRDRMLYNITIMTKLSDLINQYCPDGVEYVKLGEVAEIVRGKGLSKSIVSDDGDTNVILYGELYTHYDGHAITSICSKSHADCMQNSTLLKYGDIIMPITSTTKEAQIGIAAAYLVNEDTYLGGDAVAWRHKQNPKYLMYLMNGAYFEYEKMQHRSGTTVSHLSPKGLANITIPLPPLPVQEKIVEILDKFTALQTALQTEQGLRQQQYEYYRDKLLSRDYLATLCPDGVEYVKLGDLCEMRNGYTPSKRNPDYWREDATIPWFRMEDIRTNGHILDDSIQHVTPEAVKGGKLFPANSIILATTATIGEHALITADSLANQRFTYLTIREPHQKHMLPMFLYYYMYIVDEQCKHNINESSFASVNMNWLKSCPIPIPPLPVQEKIVEILDKFTALQTALQTELDLRKQQYEYYRDKLLTFKHK